MDLRAIPVGRGLQKAGGIFSPAPFAGVSHPSLGKSSLGETEQTLYVRGKAAVAKYDALMDRLGQISDETYRKKVGERVHGSAGDPSSAVQIRNSVYKSVRMAESDSPTNYLVFSDKPIQADVTAMENLDRTFEELVRSGESAYGTAPAGKSASLTGPSMGVSTSSVVCAAAGLVIVGTIFYFAFK